MLGKVTMNSECTQGSRIIMKRNHICLRDDLLSSSNIVSAFAD